MPTIWVPHSYPSCSQHAPDEHILLSVTRSAAALMAGLYWDIGEGKAPGVTEVTSLGRPPGARPLGGKDAP